MKTISRSLSYFGLYDSEGCSSSFYRIKNRRGIGFKTFETKSKAKIAHQIQSVLSESDMAPRVYGDIGRIRICDNTLTSWGYLTELAKPMKKCRYNFDCICFTDECDNGYMIRSVEYDLEKYYDLEYRDGHRDNFGYIRRNKKNVLVPIDFGIESFSSIGERYGEIWEELDKCDCFDCIRERYNNE